MTTHTPSPTDALQKAREIAELEKKQSKDWFTDDDSDIDSPDGLIATCHDSDDHAPFIVALRNAFPSIHAELEKVTQHREELLAMVKSIGKGALVHSEANKVLTAERDELLKGYREMRLAIIRTKQDVSAMRDCRVYEKDEIISYLHDLLTSFPEIK